MLDYKGAILLERYIETPVFFANIEIVEWNERFLGCSSFQATSE